MTKCPICGEVPKFDSVANHVFYKHLPKHMGSLTINCWCGVDLFRMPEDSSIESFEAHLKAVGGIEQHWTDHLMGIRDGN